MMLQLKSKKAKGLLLGSVLVVLLAGTATFLLLRDDNKQQVVDLTIRPEFPDELSSSEVYAVINEAGTFYAAHDTKQAIAVLDKYIASDQSDKGEEVDALVSKASMLQPSTEESLLVYESAIGLQPENPKPYEAAGKMYWNLGQFDKAKPYFERALEAYDAGPPEGYRGPNREYYEGLIEGKTGDGLKDMYL